MEILIISMFAATILWGKVNLANKVHRWLKLPALGTLQYVAKVSWVIRRLMKGLRCLPCLTWWIAIITSSIFVFIENGFHCTPLQALYSFDILQPMAAFVAAHLIQNNVQSN